MWRATDVVLNLPVDVRVLDAQEPFVEDVLDAARRASAVHDARMARVIDVGGEPVAHVVCEHPVGRDLAQLCASGPLSADTTRRLVGEAAQALALAGQRGLHHLRLEPHSLVVQPDGTVKLLGTSVEAAANGIDLVDPESASRVDAVGLVRLLYAGLTGRWPGPGVDGMGDAPRVGGQAVPPADLVPGVPNDLDTICAVTLGTIQDGPRTPAELAEQLAPWTPAVPLTLLEGSDPAPRPQVPPTSAPGITDRPASPGPGQAPAGPGHRGSVPEPPATVVRPPAGTTGLGMPGAQETVLDLAGLERASGSGHPFPDGGTRVDLTGPGLHPPFGTPDAARPQPGSSALPYGGGQGYPQAGAQEFGGGLPEPGHQAPVPAPPGGPASTNTPWAATPVGAPPSAGWGAAPQGSWAPATADDRGPAGPLSMGGPIGSGGLFGGPSQPDPRRTDPPRSGPPTRQPGPQPRQPGPPPRLLGGDYPGPATTGTFGFAWEDPSGGGRDDGLLRVLPEPRKNAASGASRMVLIVLAGALLIGLFLAVHTLLGIGSGPNLFGTGKHSHMPSVTNGGSSTSGSTQQNGSQSTTAPTTGAAVPAGQPLQVLSVTPLDPQGDGTENNDRAPRAIDGKSTTYWASKTYKTQDFGHLKTGLGLVLQLPPNSVVSQVSLDVPGTGGQVQLRSASGPANEGSTEIGGGALTGGTSTFTLSKSVTTSYLVLWFTQLPQVDGSYRIEVAEVRVQ